MTVKELRKLLKQYEVNDHGHDTLIMFWDVRGDCELELNPQSDPDPGFEEGRALGCGCFWDLVINLREKCETTNISPQIEKKDDKAKSLRKSVVGVMGRWWKMIRNAGAVENE